MIRIAHVLCPIDFSDFSRRALDHAAAMAKCDEARLSVLYVVPARPVAELPPTTISEVDLRLIRTEIEQFVRQVPREIRLTPVPRLNTARAGRRRQACEESHRERQL